MADNDKKGLEKKGGVKKRVLERRERSRSVTKYSSGSRVTTPKAELESSVRRRSLQNISRPTPEVCAPFF